MKNLDENRIQFLRQNECYCYQLAYCLSGNDPEATEIASEVLKKMYFDQDLYTLNELAQQKKIKSFVINEFLQIKEITL